MREREEHRGLSRSTLNFSNIYIYIYIYIYVLILTVSRIMLPFGLAKITALLGKIKLRIIKECLSLFLSLLHTSHLINSETQRILLAE